MRDRDAIAEILILQKRLDRLYRLGRLHCQETQEIEQRIIKLTRFINGDKMDDTSKIGRVPDNSGAKEPHSFVDCSDRFPLDVLLRKYKFRIYSRETNKEPVWELWMGHEWVKFKQREALFRIPKNEVLDAGYQQELHEKRWD